MTSFAEFGISPSVVEVLRQHGIREATPVQERAIPANKPHIDRKFILNVRRAISAAINSGNKVINAAQAIQ